MNLKKLATGIICMCLAMFSTMAFAQNKEFKGKVTDSKDGSVIAGISVQGITVSGKKVGTATSTDGTFNLSTADGIVKVILSGAGFDKMEVYVNGKSEVAVSMVSSNTSLNEVVVIGYGTARKKDLTGAVSTVQAKDFNKGTYTSADQLIQGKVAGVQMINNSGAPGGASTVKIRGNSTVTGTGQPLYIVDGVPLDGRSPKPGLGDVGLGGSNPGSNPLNFINPSDIATMDILKDASATAIYGSRAAYGVVLITTKRGQSGQTKMDIGASTGFSNIAKSGGNDNAKFRLSFGTLDQTGIVRKTGIKKYTANLSANFKFLDSKKLGLDVNIIPSQYSEEIAPISNNAGSRGSLIGNALQWNPTKLLKLRNNANTADSFNVVRGGDLINPLAVSEAVTDRSKVTTILASISPYYKFSKSLEYRFLYSVNYGAGTRRTSIQPFINFNDVQDKGRALIGSNELMTQQATHTLNFNHALTSKLNLTALVGYEYLKYTNSGFSMNGYGAAGGGFGNYGLDFTNYIQYSNPTNRGIGSFSDPSYEIQSYFGRANLNYNDKYLLTATFRADGSSKFGVKNKYGYFPSFSGAWNISKESFFRFDFINSMKIRGGWGKTGNQEFPSGSAIRRYGFGGDGISLNIVNNANENLKWQSDRQYNIGTDITLLNNRVTFTVDYFNKKTTDLLFPSESIVPFGAAGAVTWNNLAGNIVNKGFEFAVNASIIKGSDFNWDLGVNATFIKNNVSGLPSSINTGALDGQGISGSTVEVIRNNLPINSFVTRKFLGFDKATGLANYADGGDVLYYAGSPNPKTLVGLSSTVQYKKLSFTANMNGAFGQLIYNNTLNNVINVGSINNGKNIALSVYQDPIKESFANPVTASSRFLEKGDYLKLTNATISYAIGNIGKTFRGVNVYVTGQNLLVITKYSGFDPEVNTDKGVNGVPSVGIEYIPYPSARTVTFGVNISL